MKPTKTFMFLSGNATYIVDEYYLENCPVALTLHSIWQNQNIIFADI